MLVLTYHLPAVIRMNNWELLYSINRDGYSSENFFAKIKDHEYTMLVIKDQRGHVFGAFCTEEWQHARGFRGNGESWVYTFHNGEDLHLSPATGMNEMYQHADADGLIIGGS